jgi:hypothetical protein
MENIRAGSWADASRLTAEEADLLEPLPPRAHEPWVAPLTVRPNDAANEVADETDDD